jgi:hypothetical protein
MKFLKRISSFFAGANPEKESGSFELAVQCARCGEVIRARIDLANDLSAEYGEGDNEASYFCRKILIGKQSCYAPIEVVLRFDANRNLMAREITGGKFMGE